MIRLVVLTFLLAVLVLGAMTALGQSNDPCDLPPDENPPAACRQEPTATAWRDPYPIEDAPGPGISPYPAPEEGRVLELKSFLKTVFENSRKILRLYER